MNLMNWINEYQDIIASFVGSLLSGVFAFRTVILQSKKDRKNCIKRSRPYIDCIINRPQNEFYLKNISDNPALNIKLIIYLNNPYYDKYIINSKFIDRLGKNEESSKYNIDELFNQTEKRSMNSNYFNKIKKKVSNFKTFEEYYQYYLNNVDNTINREQLIESFCSYFKCVCDEYDASTIKKFSQNYVKNDQLINSNKKFKEKMYKIVGLSEKNSEKNYKSNENIISKLKEDIISKLKEDINSTNIFFKVIKLDLQKKMNERLETCNVQKIVVNLTSSQAEMLSFIFNSNSSSYNNKSEKLLIPEIKPIKSYKIN